MSEQIADTARTYYNSSDADNFYHEIWGGEDIHIGLYKSETEPIREASVRTVETMADKLKNLSTESRILDLGAGYGGAARFLAAKYSCFVECLNLSETQNQRNRNKNKAAGLEDKIHVTDGSFEDIPFADRTFDIVWSEDSFLHSGQREVVIKEAARVLKPGGEFIFTDPMQSNDPKGSLENVYERIHLNSMGSPGFYENICDKYGLSLVEYEDHTHQLVNHYSRVRDQLNKEKDRLKTVSPDYVDRMITGLGHWINSGKNGDLAWGIMHFKKVS